MSPCACLKGCSHAANGAREVDPESQRTWDSASKSNEWGKEGVRRGGATMNNVQKMKTGLLSVRLGFPGVKRREGREERLSLHGAQLQNSLPQAVWATCLISRSN